MTTIMLFFCIILIVVVLVFTFIALTDIANQLQEFNSRERRKIK